MPDEIQVAKKSEQEKKIEKKMASKKEKEQAFKPIKIKHCRFSLISQLIILQFPVVILAILAALTLYAFTLVEVEIFIPAVFLYIALLIADIAISINIYMTWLRSYYEISLKSITYYYRTIFYSRINTYKVEQAVEVRLLQGFIGKMFNCGDIIITDPTVPKPTKLNRVPEPSKIRTIIEEAMIEQEKVDTDVVFPSMQAGGGASSGGGGGSAGQGG